jgi:hypothetical protein
MPLLLQKWAAIADDNINLFPLLECFSCIALAIKDMFLPYAPLVWQRSIRLTQNTLMQAQVHNTYLGIRGGPNQRRTEQGFYYYIVRPI